MKKIASLSMMIILLISSAVYAEVFKVVVENLNISPSRYINNIVEIEGIVDRHLDDGTSAGFFFLRDDFGDFVRVRVLDNKPEVNMRVVVRGVFTRELPPGIIADFVERYYIDSRSIVPARTSTEEQSLLHLVVIESEPIGAEVFINGRVVGVTPFQDRLANGTYTIGVEKTLYKSQSMNLVIRDGSIRRVISLERSQLYYGLIGGSGLLLMIIIGIVFIAVKNGKNTGNQGYGDYKSGSVLSSGPVGVPPSAPKTNEAVFATQSIDSTESKTSIDNKTVKIYEPLHSNTVKVMPAHFDVLEGLDEVNKLYLYAEKNKSQSEYSFGRNPGDKFYHFQIKSPTVSREQAKLLAMKQKFVLVNYASSSSNPTIINDQSMDINESYDLNNGDIITMGDVKLKFVLKNA